MKRYEKRWGKQSYLATSREDIREALTILGCCFTDSLCSRVHTPIDWRCLNAELFPVVSFNLAHFPKPKLRLIEYNLNWCRHHTLHFTSYTNPKRIFTQNVRNNNEVLSYLEIPLTSMHVLRTSSPGSRPRLVSYPFKKAPLQPVRMSLITVFI